MCFTSVIPMLAHPDCQSLDPSFPVATNVAAFDAGRLVELAALIGVANHNLAGDRRPLRGKLGGGEPRRQVCVDLFGQLFQGWRRQRPVDPAASVDHLGTVGRYALAPALRLAASQAVFAAGQLFDDFVKASNYAAVQISQAAGRAS